ncbi:MAG: prepilin peptidase, partial [Myxococcota bacterium]
MSDTAVHIYFLAVFGSLGAVVGSFLNVVIGRLPEELSVVHPRSRCPQRDRGQAPGTAT